MGGVNGDLQQRGGSAAFQVRGWVMTGKLAVMEACVVSCMQGSHVYTSLPSPQTGHVRFTSFFSNPPGFNVVLPQCYQIVFTK